MPPLPFPRTWWIDPGRVLGGRFPGTADATETDTMLRALLSAGVASVINLQEEDELGSGSAPFPRYDLRLAELASEAGRAVAWGQFPVRDMTAPPSSVMRAVLDRIRETPGITYVHCWGGHGRTGSVAGCWLRERGLGAEAAFAQIRSARAADAYLRDRPAPQTDAQRDLVRGWPQGRAAPG